MIYTLAILSLGIFIGQEYTMMPSIKDLVLVMLTYLKQLQDTEGRAWGKSDEQPTTQPPLENNMMWSVVEMFNMVTNVFTKTKKN